MALSGSALVSTFNYRDARIELTFNWEVVSQDVETNSSTISWNLVSVGSGKMPDRMYLIRDGNQLMVRYPTGEYTYEQVWHYVCSEDVPEVDLIEGSKVILTGTTVVEHLSTDNMSFEVWYKSGKVVTQYGEWDYYNTGFADVGFVTFTIDYIVRKAVIKTCPTSMTDEDSVTITYANPAGDFATLLQAGMSLTTSDSNMAIPYRNLNKTGTSYTFNFTSSEKANLYKVLDDGASSARLRLFLKSTVPVLDGSSSETVKETRDISLTFINFRPTINVQLKATDSVTLNATGDEKIFINGVSDIYFNLNPSIKKGAVQSSIWIGNGGNDQFTATGYLNDVTTNFFSASLADSRGYRASEDITIGEGKWSSYRWIEYFPLSLKVSQGLLDANGKLDVTLTGKFFSGNFGKKANSFKYQYNIRKTTSGTDNWSSLITVSPDDMNIDNQGNYSYTFSITGLEYTERYALTVDAVDEIMSDMAETSTVIGAIPVFDWSKEDFNFNVPVNFSEGFTVPNNALKQLWNGQYHMNGTTTSINLIENISAQPNGIVLIFTPYDSSTGLANDEKLMSFFVSKKTVQVMPSKLHTFLLIPDASFSTIGAKSVYISDNRITGYAASGNSGTSKGVTFNNAGFVLRWVLGV